jgi:hypothetical protein
MPANNLITRVPNHFIKTITFDGTAGAGLHDNPVALATITGRVQLYQYYAYCITTLTGASATIEAGTANNTAAMIAQTTATDIDATQFWKDATPSGDEEIATSLRWLLVAADLVLTVGTAPITAGKFEFAWLWVPMSSDGNIA